MSITLFSVILPLCAVLVCSLQMSKTAAQKQQDLLIKLERLAILERRRAKTREVIKTLEAMDDHAELMRALYLSLREDLLQLRELDPQWAGIEAEINHATARHSSYSSNGKEPDIARLEKASALESLREVTAAGAQMNEALAILRRLRRTSRITPAHFATARNRLRYLSAMVSVNSSIRMAQIAIENKDAIKALASYRRAESVLNLGMLSPREKAAKLAMIAREKEKLYDRAANEQGLLMLAPN